MMMAKPLSAPAGLSAAEAARHHLVQLAPRFGLKGTGLESVRVEKVHDVGHGPIVVTMGQRVAGLEVYRGHIRMLMRRDLALVATGGLVAPVAPPKTEFVLSDVEALGILLSDLHRVDVPASVLEATGELPGGYTGLVVADGVDHTRLPITLDGPARVKPMYFREGDKVEAAYFVEAFSSFKDVAEDTAYRYMISAEDGRILERRNLTAHEAYSYRVWAEQTPEGRPLDGPIEDFTPHPTGTADGVVPAPIAPVLVEMESFKSLPAGETDPWLFPGSTETSGNNVDAYTDTGGPDGFSNGDLRATVTSAGVFDRIYDPNAAPLVNEDQQMAAVTHLFYVTNWLHDYFYDSGFNEAAGNAQKYNFDRGGIEGDAMRAEAQEGALVGNRNNANMSTPADGRAPRMQMFLWSGKVDSALTLSSVGDVTAGTASFGPDDYDMTGTIVLVDDAVDTGTDGCEAIVNNIAGQIAMLDRGGCSFVSKAMNAQAAGAIAVILADNREGTSPPGMGGTDEGVTIPMMSLTQVDGDALKTALQGGPPVNATLSRTTGVERAGDLDSGIVAHEWGHYFHHRLSDCNTAQCGAMSEGWGDFLALHMMLRDGDNLDGTYAAGFYGPSSDDAPYFGLRRYPYSVDRAKNNLTFRHIADGEALPEGIETAAGGLRNSEVHNAGEVWASALFEVYVGLIRDGLLRAPARTFDQSRRRMADYMVAGLMMSPPDATMTEVRDAMLAAMAAGDEGDMQIAAEAFASRGLGSCAVAPGADSSDFVGTVESFETKTKLSLSTITVTDTTESCDADGVLDAGETGLVTFTLQNAAPFASGEINVTVSSTNADVSFPEGATVQIASLASFAAQTITVPVALAEGVSDLSDLALSVLVEDPEACDPMAVTVANIRAHSDVVEAGASTDDVEADRSAWTVDNGDTFTRVAEGAFAHFWRGEDAPYRSDVRLVSPVLEVSETEAFTMAFDHRFKFEVDDTTNWDGSVIEVSTDDGASWADLADYADLGYGGPIGNAAGNPLADRAAFVGVSPDYPAMQPFSVDFGMAFAGQSIRIRFRVGTDAAAGDEGWDLDNFVFGGLTNTPFTQLVADQPNACPTGPVANAGADQTVLPGTNVLLDGSASSDDNGDVLTFAWSQSSGDVVDLLNADRAVSVFVAPSVTEPTVYTFSLEVSDGTSTAVDEVTVTVAPAADDTVDMPGDDMPGDGTPMEDPAADGGMSGGGGCGCRVAAPTTSGTHHGVALVFCTVLGLVLTRRRRRR